MNAYSYLVLPSLCSFICCFAQLGGGKGHDARVMYLCFAFLLIDRALSKRPDKGGTRRTDMFEKFLRTMPTCAAPMRDALVSKGHELTLGDEDEPFFDKQRLDILKCFAVPSGGTKKNGRRTD